MTEPIYSLTQIYRHLNMSRDKFRRQLRLSEPRFVPIHRYESPRYKFWGEDQLRWWEQWRDGRREITIAEIREIFGLGDIAYRAEMDQSSIFMMIENHPLPPELEPAYLASKRFRYWSREQVKPFLKYVDENATWGR